jgi:hydroxypyruvate isomerase
MNRRNFIQSAAAAGLGAMSANAGAISSGGARDAAQTAQTPPALKLKYAIPTSFFSAGRRPLHDRLETIAAMGFKAIEFNGMKSLSREEMEAYGKKLAELGMEQGVWVTNNGPTGASRTVRAGLVRKEEHEAFLQMVRDSVEIAPLVNGKFTTVCTGNEVRGMSREEGRANVIEALKRAGEIVEGSGLTIVVEPLNTLVNHRGYFLARSDEAYEVMKAVGHPQVKILFDIYHQQITEGNLIRNIRATYDETAYYQFADNPGRNEPGTGEVNYTQVFKAIHDLGFTGIVGAEMGQSQRGDEGSRAALEAIIRCDRWDA